MTPAAAAAILLDHSANCTDFSCGHGFCASMKLEMLHFAVCDDRNECERCNDLYVITVLHARECPRELGTCRVPVCTLVRLQCHVDDVVRRGGIVDMNRKEMDILAEHGRQCHRKGLACTACRIYVRALCHALQA